MSIAHKISLPTNVGNTAQLQSVYSTIANQLAAAGLVQTSDTGQCTPSSLTWSDATSYGYQMWKFGDSLQATAPFFIKIEYQAASFSYNNSQTNLGVTFGTATDGAGNFTGTQLTDTYNWGAYMSSGTLGVSLNSYFSGDTNRFCMAYNDGPNVFNSAVWGFERTKNLDGSDSSAGLLFAFCSNGANTASVNIGMLPATSAGGPFSTAQPYWPLALNRVLPTMATGSKIGVAIPGYFNTYPCVPGLNFACYLGTDFTSYVAQTLPMYDGVNHNYMVLTSNPAQSPSNPAGAHILMRYE
jgi:hypothetical protein